MYGVRIAILRRLRSKKRKHDAMSIIRIIERSLSVYPECMHIWVESLGPVEEILDIHIKNEIAVEVVRNWMQWKPITRRTITVFHESCSYTQQFIQKEGIWQIAKE
jgi:hypothetical protein